MKLDSKNFFKERKKELLFIGAGLAVVLVVVLAAAFFIDSEKEAFLPEEAWDSIQAINGHLFQGLLIANEVTENLNHLIELGQSNREQEAIRAISASAAPLMNMETVLRGVPEEINTLIDLAPQIKPNKAQNLVPSITRTAALTTKSLLDFKQKATELFSELERELTNQGGSRYDVLAVGVNEEINLTSTLYESYRELVEALDMIMRPDLYEEEDE